MQWQNDITGLPLPDAVTTLGNAALVKVQASSNIVALAPFIPKVADAADPGNFLASYTPIAMLGWCLFHQDDMVASNELLYKPGEHPDHVVVIKYVPYVGDSKRAMDEYTSEIFMGGKSTIVMHNTCEDSLLAAPLILDMCLIAELSTRIEIKGPADDSLRGFHSVSVLLSYLTKAPLVPRGTPVVNALAKQRAMLENIFRACVGLAPENNMLLEHK